MGKFGLKTLVDKEIDKKIAPVSETADAAAKSLAAKGTFYVTVTEVADDTKEIVVGSDEKKLKAGDLVYDSTSNALWICISAGTNKELAFAE